MKKVLLSFVFALLLLSSFGQSEPTGVLGIKFGTKSKTVEKEMANNGYILQPMSTSDIYLAYGGGDFMGVNAKLIYMNIADDRTLYMGGAMFMGDVQKVTKSLIDILSKKYDKTPEEHPAGYPYQYSWEFPNVSITLGGNEKIRILTIRKKR